MTGRTIHNLMATRWIIQALRDARTKFGWTQQELADEMGIGQATVAAMEGRRFDPQFSTIVRWMEGLGVDAEVIIRSKDGQVLRSISLTGNGAKEVER